MCCWLGQVVCATLTESKRREASSRQERKKKKGKSAPHSTAIPKREKGEEEEEKKRHTFWVVALFRQTDYRPQRCHYQRSSWSNLLRRTLDGPSFSRSVTTLKVEKTAAAESHFLPLCVPAPDGKTFPIQILASFSSLGRRIFGRKKKQFYVGYDQ